MHCIRPIMLSCSYEKIVGFVVDWGSKLIIDNYWLVVRGHVLVTDHRLFSGDIGEQNKTPGEACCALVESVASGRGWVI